MTLRQLWILPMLILYCSISAQDNIKTIDLQKGQILDILLIDQKPDTQDLMQDYRKTAFPVAMKMSYEPQFGYGIADYTAGNIQPSVLVFGKWGSKDKRIQFLSAITTPVPDFHQRRKDIWSMFYLTYFEIAKDLTIKINKDKYRVATAIWMNSDKNRSNFLKAWRQAVEEYAGVDVISLADGESPKGYRYAPDQFILTEWENKEAFESFQKEGLGIDNDMVEDMHQFILN